MKCVKEKQGFRATGRFSPEGLCVLNCRRVLIPAVAALLLWSLLSCSSSSSPKTTTTTQSGGLQLTPSSNEAIELNASGVANLSISANESVSWSLASATGIGHPPPQAVLSGTTGTSTTLTYTGTAPNCAPNAFPPSPQPVEVVATTSDTPPVTTSLTVNVVQTTPCLATISANWNNQNPVNQRMASCPAVGTVLTQLANPPIQAGGYTNLQIGLGQSNGTFFGQPPYTWALTGNLPSGMQWQTSTDTTSVSLVGTPTISQCVTFQFQVTDSLGGVSCDPNVTTGCAPTTFNLAVVPTALKISVPPYSYSYDGVPYPTVALQASGTTGPYQWFQDPLNLATLAPGLALTPAVAGSSIADISGTPNAGDSSGTNGQGSGSGLSGQYPTLIYVSDSQSPYPAVGVASLNMEDFLPNTACSPSFTQLTVAPDMQNGGNVSGNAVLANNYLNGTYGFMARGFVAGQPAIIAGSMTLDGNGKVTSGILDLVNGSNATLGLAVSSGTYIVGLLPPNLGVDSGVTYSRGCVTLNSTAGPITFDFSLGGCTNHYSEGGAISTFDNACGMAQNNSQNVAAGVFTTGRIIEASDGSGHTPAMAGILRMQDTSTFSSGLSGPYAFGLAGWDSNAGHYAVAGSARASSSGLSSLAADINDAGALSSHVTGGSGTLSSADGNGRITGTLSIGSASFDVALYEISANEAFVLTTDALAPSHPLLTGEALTTASSFSAASFQNSNILAMGGVSTTGPDVSIALLTFDGISSVTGTIYEDQAATLGTTSVSAVYAVDPTTGRATFTTPEQGESLGSHGFVAYLIPPSSSLSHVACSVPASCVTGFVVGTDSTAQDGIFEFQTPIVAPPPPFSNRYIAGDYVFGTMENLDTSAASFEGDVFATPSPTNTTGGTLGGIGLTSQVTPFFQDTVYGCLQFACPVFVPEDTFLGSYSLNSNGSGIGSFGGGPVISVTNGNVNISINESPANTHPSIIISEQ